MRRRPFTTPPRVLPILLVGLVGFEVAVAALGVLGAAIELAVVAVRGDGVPAATARDAGIAAILLVGFSLLQRRAVRWWLHRAA